MTFEMVYMLMFVLFVVIVVIPALSSLAQWLYGKTTYTVSVYKAEDREAYVVEISYSQGLKSYVVIFPNEFDSEAEASTFANAWLEEHTN